MGPQGTAGPAGPTQGGPRWIDVEGTVNGGFAFNFGNVGAVLLGEG